MLYQDQLKENTIKYYKNNQLQLLRDFYSSYSNLQWLPQQAIFGTSKC